MLRYFFILLLVLSASWLFLNGILSSTNTEKPIFLRYDTLANEHQCILDVQLNTAIQPSNVQLDVFKKDYSNIWAHLNHLYATNDVNAGKEYYTEDWFKQICLQYRNTNKPIINRKDVSHKISIKNWAWDGLVCTLTDSVNVTYTFPNRSTSNSYLNLAMVLLYQGDHWRIDAIKVENQSN